VFGFSQWRLLKVFTPKALYSKAQGQRRSRATLGWGVTQIRFTPKALYKLMCNAFSVKCLETNSFPRVRDFVATLDWGM
jgi:hypothetical protein